MFQRTNKLLIDLPEPDYRDKKAALVVQELLGGKFGELSTLNNYLFQSFNFRERKNLNLSMTLSQVLQQKNLGMLSSSVIRLTCYLKTQQRYHLM